MAAAVIDHRPAGVVELSSVPQINLPSASPDLSRSTAFHPNPGNDPNSQEGPSSTPTTGGLAGTDKVQNGDFKRPQFVARDGAIGGKSHNETNVE